MKIVERLKEQSRNVAKQRIANLDVRFMRIEDTKLLTADKKPIYQDIQLTGRIYKSDQNDAEYRKGLFILAYNYDCIISCAGHFMVYKLEQEFIDFCGEQINPTCFQKFLIKLGF